MSVRVAAAAAALLAVAADAPPYRSSPERVPVTETRDFGLWAGPWRAKLIPALMRDFGERHLYAPADEALPAPRAGERRVVFLGDSITDGWDLAAAFPGQPYLNRGIGAQVSAQMLVRFRQDVVALRPAAVMILAGTNDVNGTLQVETPATIVDNVASMADIARANGIRVVLASLLPVNDYTANARGMLRERPPATLAAINRALAALARRCGYGFADYAAVTRDARGLLAAPLTSDGLHPNARGYARMVPVARAAINAALARPAPTCGAVQGAGGVHSGAAAG